MISAKSCKSLFNPVPCLDRPNTNHHALRCRCVALVREVTQRHKHVRFRKICGGAAARNAVRHDRELPCDAFFAIEMADEIYSLSVFQL